MIDVERNFEILSETRGIIDFRKKSRGHAFWIGYKNATNYIVGSRKHVRKMLEEHLSNNGYFDLNDSGPSLVSPNHLDEIRGRHMDRLSLLLWQNRKSYGQIFESMWMGFFVMPLRHDDHRVAEVRIKKHNIVGACF